MLLAMGLLPVFAATGQEALRSADSIDAVLDAQTAANSLPQPHALNLGPIALNLGTYLGVTWDDNINAVPDHAKSDTSIHSGLTLGFLWPATENSKIQLDSQLGYVTYLAHTRSDSIEIAPNSALSWGLTFPDGTLSFYDQFDYSDEVITVPSIAGLNSLPRLENNVGTRAQWLPRHWQFEAGISHSDFVSPDKKFSYLDRGSENLSLRGAWRFAENTQAGLELSLGQTAYRQKIQSDNTSYSLGPYGNWNLTQFLTVNLSGGPTIYRFAASPGRPASTLTSYYFDLELSHQLTDFVAENLSLRRDVNLGYNRGNDYTELLSCIYVIHWDATQFSQLGLTLTYELGDQPLTDGFFSIKENFHRIGIGTSASYHLTDKLTGSMDFSHWVRSSSFSRNNYSENSVSLQFAYHF